jgi:hypothetical protein
VAEFLHLILEATTNAKYNGMKGMPTLPDDALVVRGGENLPESFAQGAGVTVDASGKVQGVSFNAAPGLTVKDLTAPNAQTGYPGIPHNQVGVTTVGRIRAKGGVVDPAQTKKNPNHATLSGLTPEQASTLFRPTLMVREGPAGRGPTAAPSRGLRREPSLF